MRSLYFAVVSSAVLATSVFAATLDGKSFDVDFQTETPQKASIEFKDGLIVSPIHKTIMDNEKEIYKEQGVPAMKLNLMAAAAGAPFTDQELNEGVNFTGRVEGFPGIYWSGWVRGSEIEGSVEVESFMGGYMIQFKGTEK